MQNFASRGVDAIVLAPLDQTALARPVEAAVKRGLPVVISSNQYAAFGMLRALQAAGRGASAAAARRP